MDTDTVHKATMQAAMHRSTLVARELLTVDTAMETAVDTAMETAVDTDTETAADTDTAVETTADTVN